MHAYIITGSDEASRTGEINSMLEKLHVSGHDVLVLMPQDNTIGINAVRSIITRLSLKPFAGPYSALVIRNAHALTDEAQQALLKSLEEPPGEARVILETQQPYSLLPTILSRCHIIHLTDIKATDQSNNELSLCLKTLEQLLQSSAGERLKLIDVVAKTRDDTLAFVSLAITATHKKLMNQDNNSKLRSNESAKLLRALLTARTQLLGNANPKLVLDMAFTGVTITTSLP